MKVNISSLSYINGNIMNTSRYAFGIYQTCMTLCKSCYAWTNQTVWSWRTWPSGTPSPTGKECPSACRIDISRKSPPSEYNHLITISVICVWSDDGFNWLNIKSFNYALSMSNKCNEKQNNIIYRHISLNSYFFCILTRKLYTVFYPKYMYMYR